MISVLPISVVILAVKREGKKIILSERGPAANKKKTVKKLGYQKWVELIKRYI